MFFGRKNELESLKDLKNKKTSSLVAIQGRRRIGKSSLVQEFSKNFNKYIAIQGLGPDQKAGLREQLDHFETIVSKQFKLKKRHFDDWTEALYDLAELTEKGEVLILLDEISWMARGDEQFASKLKDAWDMKFKNNSKLILIVCGSVSTWVRDNIILSSNFVGRVSLQIDLQELSLPEINQFWTNRKYHFGSMEKMLILSVTGGVPKYLEEVLSTETAEQNLLRLCFNPNGILFNDFEKIFKDVFGKQSSTLEKIVFKLSEKKMAPIELAKSLNIEYNSDFSDYIEKLKCSGFISRDYVYKIEGGISKKNNLRLKDNYLRFYLKYILKNKEQIKNAKVIPNTLSLLKNFESFLGLQFENLILANRNIIIEKLKLDSSQVSSCAPFIQKKTLRNKGACQVDLLIHYNMDTFYLCEIKCKKNIDKTIIKEVQQKMNFIKLPNRSALKPVLIYEGELYPPHADEIKNYFYKLITFKNLLEYKANE